jgi:hypothetical protein
VGRTPCALESETWLSTPFSWISQCREEQSDEHGEDDEYESNMNKHMNITMCERENGSMRRETSGALCFDNKAIIGLNDAYWESLATFHYAFICSKSEWTRNKCISFCSHSPLFLQIKESSLAAPQKRCPLTDKRFLISPGQLCTLYHTFG